jgi:hypothetical protein
LVEIVGDSQAAAAIFRRGGSQRIDTESGELELHEAFLDIYEAAAKGGFEIVFRWVPRELLQDADALSKFVDRHDFSLRPEVLERVRRELGPWSVDRFAAAHNAKAPFFNALFHTLGSCGADAFAFSWSGSVSYMLPPFPLVDRVLDKIERDDAEAVVVLPMWRSQPFWHRVQSGAWRERLARPVLLLGEDALVANPENAENCFFGERFGAQLAAFRTRRLQPRGEFSREDASTHEQPATFVPVEVDEALHGASAREPIASSAQSYGGATLPETPALEQKRMRPSSAHRRARWRRAGDQLRPDVDHA